MLVPSDVFKPGKLPISPGNVYASRGVAEREFNKSLSRGLIPIVYGEYGVGKTSMARYALRSHDNAGTLVNIESVADKSLADVFARCLEKIGYTVNLETTRSHVRTNTHQQGGSAGASIPWLSANISSARTNQLETAETQRSELFVSSPTDSKFIEICEEKCICLLLDEMHKASDEFIDDFSKFIKAYGNANCRNFKIVILGTSSDPSRLVNRDPGVDRLVEEVHLEAMSHQERNYLVEEGMRSLAIRIDDETIHRLADICVGSPNILQWLCLEASESAFNREPRILISQDVTEAIDSYATRKESRLYRIYMAAVENKGEFRFRKQILRAMSESDSEYVTMEEIKEKICLYLDKSVESTDISGPLRSLKQEQFGPVLCDVSRSDGGRIQNYTTFVDPALKAYIRMLNAREVSISELGKQ